MAFMEILNAEKMEFGLDRLATKRNMERTIYPPIKDLAELFTLYVEDAFGGNRRWHGDMEAQARDNYSIVRDSSGMGFDVGENAKHGRFIRHGSKGWYGGTFGEMMYDLRAGNKVPIPGDLVEWAKAKVTGGNVIGALYIAWKIMSMGLGRTPNSTLGKGSYRANEIGYDYGSEIVNVTGKRDITATISEIYKNITDNVFMYY